MKAEQILEKIYNKDIEEITKEEAVKVLDMVLLQQETYYEMSKKDDSLSGKVKELEDNDLLTDEDGVYIDTLYNSRIETVLGD